MDYDILEYPEGYNKVRDEELGFLPDDPQIREVFMTDMLQWLIQW